MPPSLLTGGQLHGGVHERGVRRPAPRRGEEVRVPAGCVLPLPGQAVRIPRAPLLVPSATVFLRICARAV